MANSLKIVIAGCSGRMGHALLEAVFADADLVLHGALDRAGNPQLGRDAGEQAGRMKQSGRLWILWPAGTALK